MGHDGGGSIGSVVGADRRSSNIPSSSATTSETMVDDQSQSTTTSHQSSASESSHHYPTPVAQVCLSGDFKIINQVVIFSMELQELDV